jgi:hypothetical protein
MGWLRDLGEDVLPAVKVARVGPGDGASAVHRRGKGARSARALGFANLAASLAPGGLFALGLLCLSQGERFAWLRHSPLSYPWELWVIAVAGGLATSAGVLDWRLHRRAGIAIGAPERRAELVALVFGGLPLFALMAAATALRARWLLVPVVAQALFVAILVSYDEFVFHRRRCSAEETRLHRILTLGQTVALLGWMHFCFVREA